MHIALHVEVQALAIEAGSIFWCVSIVVVVVVNLGPFMRSLVD